ncbi:C2H2-type zinc-finger protein [Ceratobasidium theobromae]|uniref:C2H2-type zinc-finger protein n=1 Tax=Ceratobasidium theobromae TaxID=1582974 RepID=A0A5N5QX27_9AGAM|nr:C2H2-type zinc-finger protein [Ceratobasidium theobromae]
MVLPVEPTPSNGHDDVPRELHDVKRVDEFSSTTENIDTDETADEEEEYDDGDYDPEVDAEAVARELGNQIWAELGQSLGNMTATLGDDINVVEAQPATEVGQSTDEVIKHVGKATTLRDPPSDSIPSAEALEGRPQHHVSPSPGPNISVTADPMIETIKTMLSLALSDPHVHYALMTTIVPGPVANGANLYTILSNSIMDGRVNPELAEPLSILISALASGSMLVSSEVPFAPPSHASFSPPSSPLKRKREPTDEAHAWSIHSAYNPSVQSIHVSHPAKSQPSEELLARLQMAASEILQVLDRLLAGGQSVSQPVVASIQRQLHQVYSFVSTCPQPQQEENSGSGTLQEIGGLIQVIGILNSVPIAQSIDSPSCADPGSSESTRSGRITSNAIGTSVYPCSTCSKVFSKLSSLRAHERTHSEGRPYRCEYAGCPASFARNHDLRRHEKSHERQMFRWVSSYTPYEPRFSFIYRCRGCDKLFSRRDALRRHKTNEKALEECRGAPMDTSTVQHDGDPPRVIRVWQNHPEAGDWSKDTELEDGEIQPDVLENARHIVGTLYATLQQHVTVGLHTGADVESPNTQTSRSMTQSEQPDSAEPPAQDEPAGVAQKDADRSIGEAAKVPHGSPPDPQSTQMLPNYRLDNEHASLLEHAIAAAAQAAQAQAEAEAALYEESYNDEDLEQDIGGWGEGRTEQEPVSNSSADIDEPTAMDSVL